MDIAKQIFESHIGLISKIQVIDSSNGDLYLVESHTKKYVLELYRSRAFSKSYKIESLIYEQLIEAPCVTKKTLEGRKNKVRFRISEYHGSVFLSHLDTINPNDRPDIANHLVDFFEYCHRFQFDGYGDIQEIGKGKSLIWSDALLNYLNNVLLRIQKLEPQNRQKILSYFHFLNEFLVRNIGLFQISNPCLVPEGINLNNVVLDETGLPQIICLNGFIAGDIHFALGELMAQTYGTWLCRLLLQKWKSIAAQDILKIRFYSFFACLKIGLKQLESQTTDQRKSETFLKNLDVHQQFLEKDADVISITDLFNCKLFSNEDFGIKLNPYTTVRTTTSLQTLEKILPIIEKAGVTRYPEITELDKTGILAFQSVRPEAEIDEETFTVFSGRGATKEDCMVSALAEAIERFSAEKKNFDSEKILVNSYKNLKKDYCLINPHEFNAPKSINFLEDETLEWVPTVNLIDDETYYTTANTVFYPYVPSAGRSLFRYFTTGLAAGNSYVEAVAHGLFEVIERDASAINLLKLAKNPAINHQSITCSTALEIIDKLKQANLNVVIRYISTTDINVPVFSVLCEELDLYDPLYVSGGYGAHLNKDIALINALNEAALSRVSTISGAREDIKKFEKKRETSYIEYKEKYRNWFDTSNAIDYQSIVSFAYPTVFDDLVSLCNTLVKAGFNKILIADLGIKDLVLPVVKVLVPGIERYSFKMTCIGRRGKAILKKSPQDVVT